MIIKDRKPWMKFRPDRWLNDEELSLCSLAAQGLWIWCIARMHLSADYGYLMVGPRAATERDIAKLTGETVDLIGPLLGELEANGVLSRRESDGCIYSRRMIRDFEASERGREDVEKRWKNKRKPPASDDPNSPPISQNKNKRENKILSNSEDISNSVGSADAPPTVDVEDDVAELFGKPRAPAKSKPVTARHPNPSEPRAIDCQDELWRMWPAVGRGRSAKAKVRAALLKRREPPERILAAARAYLASPDAQRDGNSYAKGLHSWIADRLDAWLDLTEAAPAVAMRAAAPDWWREIEAKFADSEHVSDWANYWRLCEPLTGGDMAVTVRAKSVGVLDGITSRNRVTGSQLVLDRFQALIGLRAIVVPPETQSKALAR